MSIFLSRVFSWCVLLSISIALVCALKSINSFRFAESDNDDPLKLTADQRQRLKEILRLQLTSINQVTEDGSLSTAERAVKIKDINQEAKLEGSKVLDNEQKKTLAELKKKHLDSIRIDIETRPADVFIQQIVTEDDNTVLPWLAQQSYNTTLYQVIRE